MSDLASSVQGYFRAGLASSTQTTYKAALKRFYNFCTQYAVVSPFPVTEQILCYFSAYLADQGLAPQTGRSYLSAVRSMQISLGLPDPRDHSSMPILKRVQAGIRRARMLRSSPPRIRLPITIGILKRMNQHLSASRRTDRQVLWTISTTAFFGFFRLGELIPENVASYNRGTHLSWGDVAVDSHQNPSMVQIHLKRSKCDQFGAGSDIVVGRTGEDVCPVTAILEYIATRGCRSGPFFILPSGDPVTKPWFVAQIRTILAAIGLPQQQYAGHSFRIGAATTAAIAGIEDSTIQTLGRWHSAAFLQYIRMPKARLASLSGVMARSIPQSRADATTHPGGPS
jgi:hypothetical protein